MMVHISSIERRKLERLFRMGGGYVLDFSDRTFIDFFEEHTRRDIAHRKTPRPSDGEDGPPVGGARGGPSGLLNVLDPTPAVRAAAAPWLDQTRSQL